LIKDVGGASRDASWCIMVRLTRLPPSKHVLRLSTPLISKIKNKSRVMRELKHKFREVFKPYKTNVGQKYFRLHLYRSHRYCLPSLVESKLFRLDHGGIGLGFNFG
jgi:hypothetical protein